MGFGEFIKQIQQFILHLNFMEIINCISFVLAITECWSVKEKFFCGNLQSKKDGNKSKVPKI